MNCVILHRSDASHYSPTNFALWISMRLYFKPADLLLEEVSEGEYVLKMNNQTLSTFKQAKRAIAEYNRVRRELEKKMPPPEINDAERRKMLEKFVADGLVEHNSFREPEKKSASKKSRTFG